MEFDFVGETVESQIFLHPSYVQKVAMHQDGTRMPMWAEERAGKNQEPSLRGHGHGRGGALYSADLVQIAPIYLGFMVDRYIYIDIYIVHGDCKLTYNLGHHLVELLSWAPLESQSLWRRLNHPADDRRRPFLFDEA